MNAASAGPMPDNRPRRVLERLLPWIDPQRYARERALSRRVIERADRVIAGSPVVERYRHFDRVVVKR